MQCGSSSVDQTHSCISVTETNRWGTQAPRTHNILTTFSKQASEEHKPPWSHNILTTFSNVPGTSFGRIFVWTVTESYINKESWFQSLYPSIHLYTHLCTHLCTHPCSHIYTQFGTHPCTHLGTHPCFLFTSLYTSLYTSWYTVTPKVAMKLNYKIMEIFWPNLMKHEFLLNLLNLSWLCKCIIYRLREFPSGSYVDDRLHDAVAVVMYETERTTLVRYRQCELVIVDEANLSKRIKFWSWKLDKQI